MVKSHPLNLPYDSYSTMKWRTATSKIRQLGSKNEYAMLLVPVMRTPPTMGTLTVGMHLHPGHPDIAVGIRTN